MPTTSPSREQVIEALRPVQDPELHVSVVDLDMVRDVRIADGTVGVTIALTVAGCPMTAEIEQRVRDAVGPLPGVDRVAVDLTVMTDQERAAVRQKLQGGSVAAAATGAGAQPKPPLPF